MAYKTTTATDYLDFFDQLIQSLTGLAEPGFTGTGTGDIHNMRISDTAVSETWTIAFTSATAFTVTGSVSGAQAAGTVGTPYSNTLIEFLIVNGPVAFVAADAFTVVVNITTLFTATGEQWMLSGSRSQAAATGLNTYRRFVSLKGVGLAGTDNIYVSMLAYENDLDPFFNLGIVGHIDFLEAQWTDGTLGRTSALNFARMMQGHPDPSTVVYVPMQNSLLTYWLNGDGRFFVFFAKLGTRYNAGCAGFFLPYGTPAQYPYPILVGGSSGTDNLLLSDNSTDHRHFWAPGFDCLQVRSSAGVWVHFQHFSAAGSPQSAANVWPWASVVLTNGTFILQNLNANIDGSYTLLSPIMHMDFPNEDILGELPKLKYISGFGNSAENTVTDGGDTYICFQNVFRTSNVDYVAMIQA